MFKTDRMFFRFKLYGFLKNLRFFEPFILLIFRGNGLTFLQIGVLYSVRDLSNNVLEIPLKVAVNGVQSAIVDGYLPV